MVLLPVEIQWRTHQKIKYFFLLIMTTVENDKKNLKRLLELIRPIIADLIFLPLHFTLVDTSLIISQLGNLNVHVL